MAAGNAIDLGLKIVATAVACFGVWKFFADRSAYAYAEAKDRSLGYISRFADQDIVGARATLMDFWHGHPDFVSHSMTGAISKPAYDRFVAATFGATRSPDRAETAEALFRILVFYDEVSFAARADLRRRDLDAYFCSYVVRHALVYGPFYAIMSAETGTSGIDEQLQAFAESCRDETGD